MNIIIDVAGDLTSTGHSPVSTPDRPPLPNVMMAGAKVTNHLRTNIGKRKIYIE